MLFLQSFLRVVNFYFIILINQKQTHMKRNIFTAIVLSAFLFSCAKDRTCECTTSSSAGGTSTTSSVTLVENTKSQAKANCVSSTWQTSKGETITETCTLK